jgi:tRNA threonylcarbamoyl adenosine modification protein (Sua5/YciO/YrdC/YwlC family)
MSNYITLTPESDTAVISETVTTVAELLLDGGIAVLAAEHGYIYACNAFDHDAVSRIHILRGDPDFTAAQVMIGSSEVLSGLARDFDSEMRVLVDTFWPGLLTIHLMPQAALNWDLGDHGELSEFAVRIPDRDFLRAVAKATGPLAVASAAIAGQGASSQIDLVPAHESSIAIYVDEGALASGPASTVIRRSILGKVGGLEIARAGAISQEEIAAILPTIVPTSAGAVN